MGWPRKNDGGLRLYQERKDKSFLLLLTCNGPDDAIANALSGPGPSLCGCTTSGSYLQRECKRVQWSDLPDNWKTAFTRYLNQDPDGEPFQPESVRGLWRIGNQPTKTEQT